MDLQVAIQILLTLAKITGTMLAVYMAVLIFALSDKNISQLILRFRRVRLALMGTAFMFFFNIFWDIGTVALIDPGNPYINIDIAVFFAFLLFVGSFIMLFSTFWSFLTVKKTLT